MVAAANVAPSAPITVDCQYGMRIWSGIGEIYQCLTLKMIVNKPGVLITGFNGIKDDSKNVQGLAIISQRVRYMPQGIGANFKFLIALRMEGTGLIRLSKDDLEQFPQLRKLSLLGNALDFLDSDTFQNNPLLEMITLSDARLLIVGRLLFSGLPALENVKLDLNCLKANRVNEGPVSDLIDDIEKSCLSMGRLSYLAKEIDFSQKRD